MKPLKVMFTDRYELHYVGDYVSVGWNIIPSNRYEISEDPPMKRYVLDYKRKGDPFICMFQVKGEDNIYYLDRYAPWIMERGLMLEQAEQIRHELVAAIRYLKQVQL